MPFDVPNSRIAKLIGGSAAAGLVALTSFSENTIHHTYWDPVPVLTACTGHTDAALRIGQTFTDAECNAFLDDDLVKAAQGMQDCVQVMLSDGELIAYTDFSLNEGYAAFCNSSMARLVNQGDHEGACRILPQYNKAHIGGKFVVLKGLTRRRVSELDFCLKGLQ